MYVAYIFLSGAHVERATDFGTINKDQVFESPNSGQFTLI